MSHNPFSFSESIGRVRFWLMMFFVQIIGVLNPIPVTEHTIVRHSLGGEFSAWYFTPVEPITTLSWAYFGFYAAVTLVILWLTAAAVVQRLNDLGIHWKWAAYVLACFVTMLVLELGVAGHGTGFSLIDIISLILLIPVAGVGAIGMFMILLVPGYRSRTALMTDDDMRKNLP